MKSVKSMKSDEELFEELELMMSWFLRHVELIKKWPKIDSYA